MASLNLTADLVLAWARLARQRLGEQREEIDRLNVFPVPDGDTGTNMYLTMESAVLAVDTMTADRPDGALLDRWEDADPDLLRLLAVVQTLARGALLGARGNSGIILSQVLRGCLHGEVRRNADGDGIDVPHLAASALTAAAGLAYESVGDPVEGTILTVIRVAAESASAAAAAGKDAAGVVVAAAQGAREALAQTPTMLKALADAGVVDSGGAGMVVVLDAAVEGITGNRRPAKPARRPRIDPPAEHRPHADYTGPGFEVMFLLDAQDSAVRPLRAQLGALGDSLVVVGGDGLWNVHVHTDDVGAVIEHAIAAGRPYRIRVTWLREPAPHNPTRRTGRAVIAVAHGPGVARLFEDAGAISVNARPDLSPSTGELLAAIADSGAAEVVLLPGGKDIKPPAEAAAGRAREQGIRVAVVPTRAVVQSLSAIAVHDGERGFDDDVAAMSRAAGATKYGGMTVSTRRARTAAGECKPGDVLGLVSGEITRIGHDRVRTARGVIRDLVRGDSELITLLAGVDLPESDFEKIVKDVRSKYSELEVFAINGGQPLWQLIIGVE